MKTILRASAILLLAATGAGEAWADRGHGYGHGHFGIYVGPHFGPYWGPGYFGAPYYYPPYYPAYSPPVVVERADPPVYIEQRAAPSDPVPAQTAPDAMPPGYWYFCQAAGGYYPYVRECPGGWRKVAPMPPVKP